MPRFAQPIYIAAGLRTPFGRGGGALADHDAITLAVPVAQAMAAIARPDLFVWGTVIPSLGWSNIGREIWLDAGLDPTVPSFSAVLACSTSMVAAFAAGGMLGGDKDLALVGGSEVMSNPPIATEPPLGLTRSHGKGPKSKSTPARSRVQPGFSSAATLASTCAEKASWISHRATSSYRSPWRASSRGMAKLGAISSPSWAWSTAAIS